MSGANARRSVAVRIAGHDYKIRSEGDEEGLLRIAGYVDRAMQRVRERTGTVASRDVAVLTCLNLAREILAFHEQRSSTIDDTKLRILIERVESALSGSVSTSGDAGISAGDGATQEVAAESRPRTLDLPSVESLRERLPVAHRDGPIDVQPPAAQTRLAAGGRDRVG